MIPSTQELAGLFAQYPVYFNVLIALLGALVGSFLNVVIARLPTMLQAEWKHDCCELLNMPPPQSDNRFNLMWPPSQCPKCQHAIRWYENIPVISYLFLRGQCSGCKTPISLQYPVVELITALCSLTVALRFGPTVECAIALIVTWSLISLTFIDLKHMILPDNVVLPLLWLGLLASTMGYFLTPTQAIVSAAAGYLSLWSVYWGFKLLTGKEGMGYGDFKLLAAICVFTHAKFLPLILLISSISGLVIGVFLIKKQARENKEESVPIPFGPFLAIGGWVTLLWGKDIANWYLGGF